MSKKTSETDCPKKDHLKDIRRTRVSESPSRPTANGDENGSIIGGRSGVPFPSNQSVAQSAKKGGRIMWELNMDVTFPPRTDCKKGDFYDMSECSKMLDALGIFC